MAVRRIIAVAYQLAHAKVSLYERGLLMRWMMSVVAIFAIAVSGPSQNRGDNPAHVTKTPFARDGTPAGTVLPVSLHMKNTGGNDRSKYNPRGEPGKGSGLCVFTSIEMVCRSLNLRDIYGLQKWMTEHPGGGWPEKVTEMLKLFCKQKAVPVPDYFQVEANDLDILRKALRSGRPVGITYSYSPTGNYQGKKIAHMVMLAAAGAGKGPDGKGWWAVVDNNYPGQWEWMSEAQFLSVASGGSRLWAVIFIAPAPPPPPAY
jgi:hypothetical protein